MVLSEIRRYYNSARLFRFFIHHPFIYRPIFRDLIEKRFGLAPFVRPRNIVIKLNTACNAKCEFCYAKNEPAGKKDAIALDDWKAIIDQAHRLGCYTVTLTGGEPLLFPDVMDLVAYIREKKMLTFCTTNGIDADPKVLRELERVGLCTLNWSLHGPREHHDRLVAVEGAYQKILENGEYCARKTRILCFVNHVLTPESIRNNWYGHAWDVMRVRGFRAMIVLPVCLSSADKSTLLNAEEARVVAELAKQKHILMDTKNYSVPRCPAGREDLLVTNLGEVQPCPFIPITFGNVKEESLEEIFLRIQNHQMFKEHSGVCMAAFDPAFIDKYIVPAFKGQELPIRIDKLS